MFPHSSLENGPNSLMDLCSFSLNRFNEEFLQYNPSTNSLMKLQLNFDWPINDMDGLLFKLLFKFCCYSKCIFRTLPCWMKMKILHPFFRCCLPMLLSISLYLPWHKLRNSINVTIFTVFVHFII